MPLPDDYVTPEVGTYDQVGPYKMTQGETYCGTKVSYGPSGEMWVCTLPHGHWGDFHVAHIGKRVLAVKGVLPWLKLPEGL